MLDPVRAHNRFVRATELFIFQSNARRSAPNRIQWYHAQPYALGNVLDGVRIAVPNSIQLCTRCRNAVRARTIIRDPL